ncbi:multidrug efflux MFS transporter permease subunit EmrB [Serratia symbiotica]|uniref:Multidrug efflux MFS transporter permease subunit EmrB n=1 Tax=Serratia symbiotica TaxID=138074 RepID=A0A7D5ST01_9GAMM|nr:multidrug efflux MFS transporter permease subunit EmrB [Serratia symbiotica]MBQ0957200.1 multidrug efflux MFS transporter permease subunit EmrB [Serratia symbiotica]QLH63454.1 multidrug efflux MFS transporter permease subunit EmrB [Serratia symbiotica]QTP13846.1 multidrug efflux MFS transporter permease subunit EmrB [Serratia symbiotica]
MPRKPLEGTQLAWMTVALAMATFMQVLDSTIANVAIPTIAGNLGSSNAQGTWVITSFGVANAISIPITGWLAKRIGEVRLFLWSTTLFVFASWLCGISNSLGMLIFFRVIQGLMAGPLIPLSQSLLLNNYPPAKRAMALALWSMTVIIAPIFGPILGGYISDNYHWGWIFFINIPFGIFVIMAALSTLRGRETKTAIMPIDAVGLGLLIVGIGSLQVMLDQGKDLDWFNSTEIITLAVIAVVALLFLIIWELTDDHPIVDLSLFKSRNFTIGCLCSSLAYMLYFGTIVLLPQLLQEVYGYTATWAGLASAPVGLIPMLLSPVIGKFGNRLDMRRLVTFSFIMYAVCFYWRAYTFEPGMDFSASAWPQFVQGFAIACFFMPLITITLSGLSAERMASASSLSNFTRTLAGSIGTSITTTLWTQRESQHHSQLTEFVNPYNPQSQEIYLRLAQIGISRQQASAYIAKEITTQGLIISANEIFWLSAGVFMILLVLVWLAKPPFSPGNAEGGGVH